MQEAVGHHEATHELNGFYCYSSDDTEFIRRFLAQAIRLRFKKICVNL